jgi:hypothetical protein
MVRHSVPLMAVYLAVRKAKHLGRLTVGCWDLPMAGSKADQMAAMTAAMMAVCSEWQMVDCWVLQKDDWMALRKVDQMAR